MDATTSKDYTQASNSNSFNTDGEKEDENKMKPIKGVLKIAAIEEVKEVDNLKTYICKKCKKVFLKKISRKQHMKTHIDKDKLKTEEEKGTSVYIGGLKNNYNEKDLQAKFELFGKLNSIWFSYRPRGFAFFAFKEKNDAIEACDKLNGTDFLGSTLIVNLQKKKKHRGINDGRVSRDVVDRRGPFDDRRKKYRKKKRKKCRSIEGSCTANNAS